MPTRMSTSRRWMLPAHGGPGVAPARAVAVDAQHARAAETAPRERGFDALRALADRREILVAALRAGRGHRRLVAAMMAAQPPVLEMQHELRRAAVAARDPAAAAAQQHRRVAAAVDENQALLAARVQLRAIASSSRADRPSAQTLARGCRGIRSTAAARRCAAVEHEQRVTPGDGVVVGLERRGRRAQHDRDVALPGAHDRQIARRVAEPFGLLERSVVLLVDDDEPELGQRREHGEPRAEHDAGAAGCARPASAQALALVQAAVQAGGARVRESAPRPAPRAAA